MRRDSRYRNRSVSSWVEAHFKSALGARSDLTKTKLRNQRMREDVLTVFDGFVDR